MSTVAKVLVVVNLILAVAFLASASNFLGRQDNWLKRYNTAVSEYKQKLELEEQRYKELQNNNVELERQGRAIQAEIAEQKKEAQLSRSQNDLLKQAHTSASEQLTRATTALQKAQDTIKANRDLIDGLQNERKALADAIRAALDQKEAAVRNLNEKELQFEALIDEKQALLSRIEDLRNELRSARLTAETAVARMGGTDGEVPMDQPAQLGQVLAVDPGANIAVISLGSEDGIRPGFRFTVSRGSQFVAVLEITDVEAKQSAGRAVKELQKSQIQRGDRVMTAR